MAKICFGQVVKNALYVHNCFCFFSVNWASEKVSAIWQNFFDWFSKLRPTCPTEQFEEAYFVSKKILYLIFFPILKEQSVFCEKYSRRECQFWVLPNHWDNYRKVFHFWRKKIFYLLVFSIREMFLAVRHKKLRGFHYCMLRVRKKFWWKHFQWKKSYCFHISWTLSNFFWISGIKFSASLSKLHFNCPPEHFE